MLCNDRDSPSKGLYIYRELDMCQGSDKSYRIILFFQFSPQNLTTWFTILFTISSGHRSSQYQSKFHSYLLKQRSWSPKFNDLPVIHLWPEVTHLGVRDSPSLDLCTHQILELSHGSKKFWKIFSILACFTPKSPVPVGYNITLSTYDVIWVH